MKKALSFLLAVVMTAAAIAVALPASAKALFSDVEDGRWSADSIKHAVENGYMNGVGGGLFDPEGSLTRAMVATVLWRREGSPAPADPSGFSDVPADEWYTDAVAWARSADVVKGLTETTFGPDEFITREQLATMLFRFSSTAPVSVPERADLSPFADDEKVSDWAGEPLEWAVETGLLKGTDGNRLAPDGFATREQFAAIIERYDGTFILKYNRPVLRSHYTEKEYPLVTDADFYVSPDGSDGNDGSFERPFATWNRAIEAVRGVGKTPEKGGITVAFKAGTYRSVHIELTAEDAGTPECPVIYCKYGDGDVIFDNGVTIPEEDFVPVGDGERSLFSEKAVDKIKKVDLTEYLTDIPAYEDFYLYSDDCLCSNARFPNRYMDGTDQMLYAAESDTTTSLHITSPLLIRRFAGYPAEVFSEMRIYGNILRGYRKDGFRVAGYDPETCVMQIANYQNPEFGGMRPDWRGVSGQGIEMFILNLPYDLDVDGEFWVDRSTGTLYVYDPAGDYNIPGAAGPIELRGDPYDVGDGRPMVPEFVMIDARDTGYVTLRGLSFSNVIGGFLFGYRISGFTFDRCAFARSTGRNHVLIEYSLDGAPMDLTIRDSEFDFSVGCAVYIMDVATGPERYTNISNVLVDNCLFRRTNLEYDVEGALNLYRCTEGLVSHNDFVECHRYGVMVDYSCDVVVEYNNFDSCMTNSEDGGVIRSALGLDANSVIRYNLVNEVPSGTVGRFAQYSDLGDCGTLDYRNLFYNGGYITVAGGGRDNNAIENFFVRGGGVSYTSNIPFILEEGDAAKNDWPMSMWLNFWQTVRHYCDTVPGYREALEERRPGASSFTFDFLDPEREDFAFAPVSLARGNVFFNDSGEVRIGSQSPEFTTLEDNRAFGLDENPFFVNPTIGDYRIKEGADCPYFPFEKIGRY